MISCFRLFPDLRVARQKACFYFEEVQLLINPLIFMLGKISLGMRLCFFSPRLFGPDNVETA